MSARKYAQTIKEKHIYHKHNLPMIMHFMPTLWTKAHFYIDFTTNYPILLRSK